MTVMALRWFTPCHCLAGERCWLHLRKQVFYRGPLTRDLNILWSFLVAKERRDTFINEKCPLIMYQDVSVAFIYILISSLWSWGELSIVLILHVRKRRLRLLTRVRNLKVAVRIRSWFDFRGLFVDPLHCIELHCCAKWILGGKPA